MALYSASSSVPNFALAGCVLKVQVCEKSYVAGLEVKGECGKTAHPNCVLASMVCASVCPDIIMDDQHLYILFAKRSQRR